MKFDMFISLLERLAPPKLAEEWDHSGIQIHSGADDIHKVLVCLDVTAATIMEAIEQRADIIVSHHPFIFDGIYSLDADDPMGKKIQELVKAGISVYSAHMTYDKSNAGNTVQMAKRLGLNGFPPAGKASGEDEDFSVLIARTEKPVSMEELVVSVRNGLMLEEHEIRLVRGGDDPITTIGLCAGSGGDYLELIMDEQCQVFITGDVKYHLAMEAKEAGVTLIDPGHFGTEKFFAADFADQLSRSAGPEVTVITTKNDKNPFSA